MTPEGTRRLIALIRVLGFLERRVRASLRLKAEQNRN